MRHGQCKGSRCVRTQRRHHSCKPEVFPLPCDLESSFVSIPINDHLAGRDVSYFDLHAPTMRLHAVSHPVRSRWLNTDHFPRESWFLREHAEERQTHN